MTTIDQHEIDKFDKISDDWWNERGKFKPLHKINIPRVEYIKHNVIQYLGSMNVSFLDIGCGGGILCEPIARLGGTVTGIDPSIKATESARIHSKANNLDIEYINITSDELIKTNRKFDVVLAMEVLEHTANVGEFIKNCASLLKNNGLIFIATINRNLQSLFLAKIAAEYILHWLPIGTHSWKKFLRPSEINEHLIANEIWLKNMTGVSYKVTNGEFCLTNNIDINYIMVAQK